MLLSKSDYLLFLRHPAWLWLKKKDHSKLPKFNPSIKQRMDDGYEFEGYAEQLFPDAKKIRFLDGVEEGTMLSQTSAAWADGARCVCHGQYQAGE